MLEFTECCWCYPLRPGSLILGVFNLILNIVWMVLSILGLRDGVAVAYHGFDINGIGSSVMIISAILLCFVMIYIVMNILLIIGIREGKSSFIRAYLTYGMVFMIIFVILFIVTLVKRIADDWVIVLAVFEIVINIYILLIVRSHNMTLR